MFTSHGSCPETNELKKPTNISVINTVLAKVKTQPVINPNIFVVILLHEKFLQVDWLGTVVFQLNLKYLLVKITNLFLG